MQGCPPLGARPAKPLCAGRSAAGCTAATNSPSQTPDTPRSCSWVPLSCAAPASHASYPPAGLSPRRCSRGGRGAAAQGVSTCWPPCFAATRAHQGVCRPGCPALLTHLMREISLPNPKALCRKLRRHGQGAQDAVCHHERQQLRLPAATAAAHASTRAAHALVVAVQVKLVKQRRGRSDGREVGRQRLHKPHVAVVTDAVVCGVKVRARVSGWAQVTLPSVRMCGSQRPWGPAPAGPHTACYTPHPTCAIRLDGERHLHDTGGRGQGGAHGWQVGADRAARPRHRKVVQAAQPAKTEEKKTHLVDRHAHLARQIHIHQHLLVQGGRGGQAGAKSAQSASDAH